MSSIFWKKVYFFKKNFFEWICQVAQNEKQKSFKNLCILRIDFVYRMWYNISGCAGCSREIKKPLLRLIYPFGGHCLGELHTIFYKLQANRWNFLLLCSRNSNLLYLYNFYRSWWWSPFLYCIYIIAYFASVVKGFLKKVYFFKKNFFLNVFVKLHKTGFTNLCKIFAKKLLTFGCRCGIIFRSAATASADHDLTL